MPNASHQGLYRFRTITLIYLHRIIDLKVHEINERLKYPIIGLAEDAENYAYF